jgi:hypothetical protein
MGLWCRGPVCACAGVLLCACVVWGMGACAWVRSHRVTSRKFPLRPLDMRRGICKDRTMNAEALTDQELSEAFESACALAARQYADGCDTTVIDSQVDLLMAEIDARQSR